jgi:hypothetical protein
MQEDSTGEGGMTNEERTQFMEFRDLLTRMDGRLERLESDMEDVRHVLIDGNGRPAMTVRMALAESEIQRVANVINEDRIDRRMPRSAWVAILCSTAIGLTSLVLGLMQHK